MLAKGDAKKVVIYLNQDTRHHAQPLWSAVLSFLRHKRVAGATLFRGDAGFGTHGEMHDPRSEYLAEHNSLRIEFVENARKVDELLPTLYEMVTDGLITMQDVAVVKCASKDGKTQPENETARKRVTAFPGKMVRIYLGESDQCAGEPLYEAIVKKLRMLDFAGATVYRGILGYGAKGHRRKSGRFHLSRDLPIMISVVEKAERVPELVRIVSEMMLDGVIVTSDTEVVRIEHHMPEAEQ